MVATAIDPAVRFANLGNNTYYWIDTIADKSAPTRTELDAGTDLTGDVFDAAGWSTSSDNIEAPDIKGDFTVQLPGRPTAEDSSLSMYISSDSTKDDVRTVLSEGDKGFVVRFPSGDTEGAKMDIFPVTVKSLPKDPSPDNPASVTVNFSISGKPEMDVDVPAAT